MNLDNLGYGAGGGLISGLITAIAVAFGFKSRLDRQDKDINSLKKNVVYKDTFEATLKPIDNRLTRMEEKLDTLLIRHRPEKNDIR